MRPTVHFSAHPSKPQYQWATGNTTTASTPKLIVRSSSNVPSSPATSSKNKITPLRRDIFSQTLKLLNNNNNLKKGDEVVQQQPSHSSDKGMKESNDDSMNQNVSAVHLSTSGFLDAPNTSNRVIPCRLEAPLATVTNPPPAPTKQSAIVSLTDLVTTIHTSWKELHTPRCIQHVISLRHVEPLLHLHRRQQGQDVGPVDNNSGEGGRDLDPTKFLADFHVHHLNLHLSLLSTERYLVVAACDAVTKRDIEIERLQAVAVKYRQWSTNHLLLAQNSPSEVGVRLSDTPVTQQRSSYANIHLLLEAVHGALDRYRIATVNVVEAIDQWNCHVRGNDYSGFIPPSWKRRGSGQEPIEEESNLLLNLDTASFRRHLPIVREGWIEEAAGRKVASGGIPFLEKTIQQPHVQCGSVKSAKNVDLGFRVLRSDCFNYRGHPLLLTILRDLNLLVFQNEPLRFLIGVSLDWNPLALPGSEWNVKQPNQLRTEAVVAPLLKISAESEKKLPADKKPSRSIFRKGPVQDEGGPTRLPKHITVPGVATFTQLDQRAVGKSFLPKSRKQLFCNLYLKNRGSTVDVPELDTETSLVLERCRRAMTVLRGEFVQLFVSKVQASARGLQTRRRIMEMQTSATKIQSVFRGVQPRLLLRMFRYSLAQGTIAKVGRAYTTARRKLHRWLTHGVIRSQATTRMIVTRNWFRKRLQVIQMIQHWARGVLVHINLRKMFQLNRILSIQKTGRGHLRRRKLNTKLKGRFLHRLQQLLKSIQVEEEPSRRCTLWNSFQCQGDHLHFECFFHKTTLVVLEAKLLRTLDECEMSERNTIQQQLQQLLLRHQHAQVAMQHWLVASNQYRQETMQMVHATLHQRWTFFQQHIAPGKGQVLQLATNSPLQQATNSPLQQAFLPNPLECAVASTTIKKMIRTATRVASTSWF